MTIIKIDEENSAEEFFDVARAAGNTPEEILEVAACGEVSVSAERAEEIRAWCEAAKGWAVGPRHARYALLFEE